ncbi:class I SAM-dependent RNA methyltransferase [Lactonifactor longoviformis]|uniref:THUMP domain-containing class I SAM-dependent RNA methyltransferase n=1 Tax=Lactonifactor TaxID=420345 RepID=UPI0012AF6360|nr:MULTISPECIES: class I SAM-dependent RNA methyltransferase [Lactonifactor]MCQ4672789.1 class I SAM-dependent RNA methyltransferase [Lactonifactor longoviformis]MSA03707.1 methyltransferase [Lactonifactor sp. BIOML-A5]MSA10164.1 methyltransferase [Lactonifactor sp. BIOML-A4]MSA14714.1 methyltransferase [Lactonifactor sp. BIOML-A3]MSA19136.1 methyltransferase [Lactonifactor sp. BIOML-A2]
MERMELIAPCHFGLEAVLKREIIDLGYDISQVEDGKVTFWGDAEAIAYANVFLRTAERVMIKVGKIQATTFEELFDKTKELPWENYIPKDGKFWVAKANSIKSKLFSPSDIQSIMKKAIVERLKGKYQVTWFEEDGPSYPIRVSFLKDVATIGLDTTGTSLHKRGYRQLTAKAPITETLAASLLMLTPWKKDRILVDPFCGSGTFPIEAAMLAADIAPGMNRSFLAEDWKNVVGRRHWYDAANEARERMDTKIDVDIQGYDIDGDVVRSARENARAAGVEHLIHFQQREVSQLRHPKKYGFLITNPPYGERLEDRSQLPGLYTEIGESFAALDSWSMYLITSYEDAEKYIGRKADKNRKIYNGMLKTYFYQFLGPKPPKKTKPE